MTTVDPDEEYAFKLLKELALAADRFDGSNERLEPASERADAGEAYVHAKARAFVYIEARDRKAAGQHKSNLSEES